MIWDYALRLVSPLSLSERKPDGTFLKSYGYVPGAIMRGALAVSLLEEIEIESVLFQHLFVEGHARLSNLLPVERGNEVVRIAPQTALTCKTYAGFKGELDKSQRRDGVFDALIDLTCADLLQPAAWSGHLHCPQEGCDAPVDHYKGQFYTVVGGQYRRREGLHRLLTRVALNRERGVAEDSLLYSPHVLSEGRFVPNQDGTTAFAPALFRGRLSVPGLSAADAQMVAAALQRVSQLGGGGSRGLGQIEWVEVQETPDAAPDAQAVRARVEAFNAALEKRWTQYQDLVPQVPAPQFSPGHGQFFTLTLESDAVLRDETGAQTFCLSPGAWSQPLGTAVQLVRSFAAFDYRGGWNALWQAPKPVELVAKMGSAYLYRAETLDFDQLARLERDGVGDYGAVGFGQVRVCDEFHRLFREEAQ